jgi:mRNA-degrading endonuclease YafQ of YafQ-DinJ toxin-antitoxin module
MARPAQAEVKWELAPGFKASWKKFKKEFPEIRAAMKVFNDCKRANPPAQLPGKMKDHKLDGPLKGFMDCHFSHLERKFATL